MISIGNLVRLPAALEVRNPGLSVNGGMKKKGRVNEVG